MTFKELLNLDVRDEETLVVEAKKREVRRELSLIQAVRFGTCATQQSYEERVQQLQFELRKYEEEY
ncbi:MAG: hypothetical protein KAV87_54265 [Desulfobacteraceae bacterium]|nr:hypothetical protein [Desulfobacteraceae bacterium]